MAFTLISSSPTSGSASWIDSTALPGSVSYLKRRFELAELPHNTAYFGILGVIPANCPVFGGAVYVHKAPTGGGVSTCKIGCGCGISGVTCSIVDLEELCGLPDGEYVPYLNNASTGLMPNNHVSIAAVDRSFVFNINADVNLDALTQFDVTLILFYARAGLTVP